MPLIREYAGTERLRRHGVQGIILIPRLPHSAPNILKMFESLDEEALKEVSPSILGDYPNTYTCTKAYAEHLVREFQAEHNVPLVIVRPSIVLATWNEPFVVSIPSGKRIRQRGWLSLFSEEHMFFRSPFPYRIRAGLLLLPL